MANKRELETFVLQQQQMQSMLQDMYTALERTNVSLQELIAQKDAEIARLKALLDKTTSENN